MELNSALAKLKDVEIEEKLIDNSFNVAPEPALPVHVLPEASPNNPPWNIPEAFGVWIASVLFIVILPTLFLLPYLMNLRPPITDSGELMEFAKSDPTSIILQIVSVIPAHIFTIMLAWLVVTRVRKYPFLKMLGWNGGGVKMWVTYPLILVAFIAIASLVNSFFPEQENDLIRILRSSRTAVYVVAFMATFTAPFVEEVVYRGILYSSLQRRIGVPAGFALVTFLFAVVHVPQYYPSYSTIFLLLLLSITLTSIRVKTGNLLPCVILHTLFNGMQSVGLLFNPYSNTTDVPDPSAFIFHLLK